MLDLRPAQLAVTVPYRQTETSVRNYHYTLRNSPEERNYLLLQDGRVLSSTRRPRALAARKFLGTHIVLEAEWTPGILNADRRKRTHTGNRNRNHPTPRLACVCKKSVNGVTLTLRRFHQLGVMILECCSFPKYGSVYILRASQDECTKG
jgi:hypothetical protein